LSKSPSPAPRLTDIVDAVEMIRNEMVDVTIEAFESDRRKRWVVERGLEIGNGLRQKDYRHSSGISSSSAPHESSQRRTDS